MEVKSATNIGLVGKDALIQIESRHKHKESNCHSPRQVVPDNCPLIVPKTTTINAIANNAVLSSIPAIAAPSTPTAPVVGVGNGVPIAANTPVTLLFDYPGNASVIGLARLTTLIPVIEAGFRPNIYSGLGVTKPSVGAQYNIGISVLTNGNQSIGVSATLGFTPGSVSPQGSSGTGIFTPTSSSTSFVPIAVLNSSPFTGIAGGTGLEIRYDFFFSGSDTIVRGTGKFSINFNIVNPGTPSTPGLTTAATTIIPTVFDVGVSLSSTSTIFVPSTTSTGSSSSVSRQLALLTGLEQFQVTTQNLKSQEK